MHGRRARRPPRQRDQARQRAGEAASGPPRADEIADAGRPARVHRPGRRRRARAARRRRRRRRRLRDAAPTGPTPTCAASSPAATSPSSAATSARSRPGDTVDGQPDPHRAGDRDRQHLQARHALLRAARARRTSTRRARSSHLSWAPTGSARRGSPPPPSSSSPTSKGISWPRSLAPWDVELVALGKPGTEERELAERALRRARRPGLKVLSTTATPARARSSPTPSCSAARCASPSGRRSAGERRARGAGPPRAREPRDRPARGRRGGGAELWRELP